MWRSICEEEEESEGSSSPGSVSQQQLRRHAAALFHYEFSLLWPLINNISLVLFCFVFFRKHACFVVLYLFNVA